MQSQMIDHARPRRGAHRLGQHPADRLATDWTSPAPRRPSRSKGAGLLTAAACLLLLLAAAQGYVSFRAQYTFIDHTKRTHLPSMLEALGLDTGAVIFALLALSLARNGRSGTVERILNVACAIGSMIMNLLAANLTSPRSVTVWVMPSVLYALASDRLIAVVRRWVVASEPGTQVADQGSPWRAFGGLVLWLLRLVFDPLGTLSGLRRWVIAVAPIAPGARAVSIGQAPRAALEPPTRPARARPALMVGEKKREALIRLYEQHGRTGDPRHSNPAKAAEMAGEIAAQIGYHAGTARRELARYLAAQPPASSNGRPRTRARIEPATEPDPEAVA